MEKQEIRDLIVIGWNLHLRQQRNITNKKKSEKLIDDEVEKYLLDKNGNKN